MRNRPTPGSGPGYHRQTPVQMRAAEPMTVLLAPAKATLLNFGIWIGLGTILAATQDLSPLLFVAAPMSIQPALILLQLRDPHYMTVLQARFAQRRYRPGPGEIDAAPRRVHLA
jgi:hypothetical protein